MRFPGFANRVKYNILVIIDSPPPTHSQIATNALRIGKHVVCTLPAGLNLNDAKKMIQASCYYPTLLAAASSPLRFLDQIQRIKNMVRSGKAGRVLTIEAKLKDNVSFTVKLSILDGDTFEFDDSSLSCQ